VYRCTSIYILKVHKSTLKCIQRYLTAGRSDMYLHKCTSFVQCCISVLCTRVIHLHIYMYMYTCTGTVRMHIHVHVLVHALVHEIVSTRTHVHVHSLVLVQVCVQVLVQVDKCILSVPSSTF
jgi:hypothetical protein